MLSIPLGSLFFPFGGFALFSGPVVALWMCSLELVSFASLGLWWCFLCFGFVQWIIYPKSKWKGVYTSNTLTRYGLPLIYLVHVFRNEGMLLHAGFVHLEFQKHRPLSLITVSNKFSFHLLLTYLNIHFHLLPSKPLRFYLTDILLVLIGSSKKQSCYCYDWHSLRKYSSRQHKFTSPKIPKEKATRIWHLDCH